MEGVFDNVIQKKGRFCITREDQLLLYVKREGRAGKSYVICVLEKRFTLLNNRNKLMISILAGYITEVIGRSKVDTALSMSTYKARTLCINMSKIWTH